MKRSEYQPNMRVLIDDNYRSEKRQLEGLTTDEPPYKGKSKFIWKIKILIPPSTIPKEVSLNRLIIVND